MILLLLCIVPPKFGIFIFSRADPWEQNRAANQEKKRDKHPQNFSLFLPEYLF